MATIQVLTSQHPKFGSPTAGASNLYIPATPFHVKTSQSAKNQLDPAKNENWSKKQYMPFLHETLQI